MHTTTKRNAQYIAITNTFSITLFLSFNFKTCFNKNVMDKVLQCNAQTDSKSLYCNCCLSSPHMHIRFD